MFLINVLPDMYILHSSQKAEEVVCKRTSTEKLITSASLDVKILAEQAIRYLKRCRIISNEM